MNPDETMPLSRFAKWLTLPAALLASITAYGAFVHFQGEEVLLDTVPVDPADLFRGQYMQLSYRISTIDTASIGRAEENWRSGDRVFVALYKGERFHEATYVAQAAGMVPEGLPCIRGQVQSVSGATLRIAYGIESYFFPQDAKQPAQTDGIAVLVAVTDSCHPQIKQLYVDGKKWP